MTSFVDVSFLGRAPSPSSSFKDEVKMSLLIRAVGGNVTTARLHGWATHELASGEAEGITMCCPMYVQLRKS